MHIENITSNGMSLDRNGQSMLIQVYEKEINRLNNIINEAIGFTNSHFKEMVADEEAQALLSILNKGSEEDVKKNNTNSN